LRRSITPNTRAIILNSPNNPTGAIYGAKKLQQLSELLRKKNRELGISIVVIEDAPYGQIVFENNKLNSILSYYNYTFFVYSFSKSLGLAGERIGFIAVHPDIERCPHH
jgi:aspartate aminotransferase